MLCITSAMRQFVGVLVLCRESEFNDLTSVMRQSVGVLVLCRDSEYNVLHPRCDSVLVPEVTIGNLEVVTSVERG